MIEVIIQVDTLNIFLEKKMIFVIDISNHYPRKVLKNFTQRSLKPKGAIGLPKLLKVNFK